MAQKTNNYKVVYVMQAFFNTQVVDYSIWGTSSVSCSVIIKLEALKYNLSIRQGERGRGFVFRYIL